MLPIPENTLTTDIDASTRISKDSMDSSAVEPFDEILSAEAAKPPPSIDAVSPDEQLTPLRGLEPTGLHAKTAPIETTRTSFVIETLSLNNAAEAEQLTPLRGVEPTGLHAKTAPIETTRTSFVIETLSLNNAAEAERGQVGDDGNILRTGGKNLPVLPPDAVFPGENKEDSDPVDAQITALGVYSASSLLPPTGVLAKVNDFFNLQDQGYTDSIPSRGKASVVGGQEVSLLPGLTTKMAVRPDVPSLSGTPSEALPVTPEKLIADTSFLRLDADPSAMKQSAITPTQALIGGATLPFGGLEGSSSLKMIGSSQVMGGSQVLSTPLGGAQWNSDLAGRVSVMLKNGLSEASLQLTPPELGRLEIKIVTEGDQAKINFVVHSVDAKDAIELAMPRLREMLGQVGLQLAQGEVADHSQSGQRGSHVSDSFSELSANDLEEGSDQAATQFPVREVTGLVDYYV